MIKEAEELASYYMEPFPWSSDLAKFSFRKGDWETSLALTGKKQDFILSPWARSQINTRMGVRPKWFETDRDNDRINYAVEAEERNLRRRYMKGAKLLLSSGEDEEAHGIVRGIVGPGYKDIPYTFILECLRGVLPLSGAAEFSAEWSLLNYKRLHLMYIGSEELKFPGTRQTWRPGVLLRSSEVATSSFTIYPAMSFGKAHMPILLKEAPSSFRRAHNCVEKDLLKAVHEGMIKAARFFTDPKSLRVLKLVETVFPGKDDAEKNEAACEAIESACRSLRLTRKIENSLKEHYEAEGDLDHTGVRVLISLQKMAEKMLLREEDTAVEMPQWTGALLFHIQS